MHRETLNHLRLAGNKGSARGNLSTIRTGCSCQLPLNVLYLVQARRAFAQMIEGVLVFYLLSRLHHSHQSVPPRAAFTLWIWVLIVYPKIESDQQLGLTWVHVGWKVWP